jgi:hypothetical protein
LSFPNIPNITPLISISAEQTIPLLLSSIALEELALAHIMNAEAEKLQFALGTLGDTGVALSPAEVSLGDLLDVNASIQRTLRDVIKKEMLLEFKFENVLDLIGTLPPPAPQVFEFFFTGDVQEFVVPMNVTRIRIEAWGAQGGPDSFPGGLGGYAFGETDVTPGETLFVFVGGRVPECVAGTGGGFNGGGDAGPAGCSGGGGGASDVRRGGTSLDNRIIVAGGGGGSGQFSDGGPGGSNINLNGISGEGTDYTADVLEGDGGGGGGGFIGGDIDDTSTDRGGFGGSSFTGTLENAGTTSGQQTGNGFVRITTI